MPLYEQLVAANPTIGLYWWRLGSSQLGAGEWDKAVQALEQAHELGAFQWSPLRIAHRGEQAWGLAAAHAEAGRKDEAVRWTTTALAEGLRDIRRFHGKHFRALLDDAEYRKLVWADDASKLPRADGFRHDLRFLLHEVKRMHFDPFRSTREAEIDSLATGLDAEIDKLNDEQILVRMMRIIRLFGDGHTNMRGRGTKPARLPIELFLYPEGVHIFAADEEHRDLVGAKIVAVNGRTIADVMAAAEEITSRDNPMTVKAYAPYVLASTSLLRGLGFAQADTPVTFDIEDATGKSRQVQLEPTAKRGDRIAWVRNVAGQELPLPRSLAARDKTYWFEPLAEQKAIYFQFNGVVNDGNETLREFFKRLFAAVAEPEVECLVIDMRYNGGGDTFLNVPLIEGIISSDKLNQPGRLFVIIGRHTFSAAQNTVSELERRTKAILVGEPTGSSPNFIGESVRVTLPYSQWGVSVSDLWWQHSMAMDYRIWTPPMLYAPPTATAFRAHRDPAMETIWRTVRPLRGRPDGWRNAWHEAPPSSENSPQQFDDQHGGSLAEPLRPLLCDRILAAGLDSFDSLECQC